MTDAITKATYQILYTNQKTKKAKTWHDGSLEYDGDTCIGTLWNEQREKLDK